MKKVTAYQCEYCDQLFEYDPRHTAHKKYCSKNPGSKSCQTCAFFRLEHYQFGKHDWFTFEGCIKNIDLSFWKKDNCCAYKNRSGIDENEFQISLSDYNRNDALKRTALMGVEDYSYNYSWCIIEGFDFDAVEDDEYITSKDDMSSQRFD